MATTQGRLGVEGLVDIDHSTSGCSVIALLIGLGALHGITGLRFAENVIDVLCQSLLKNIRDACYPGLGFALVSAEEAFEAAQGAGLIPTEAGVSL